MVWKPSKAPKRTENAVKRRPTQRECLEKQFYDNSGQIDSH